MMRPLGHASALSVCVIVLTAWPITEEGHAQEVGRLNPVIAALEAGEAAVANQHWRFVDMEHSPFSSERLATILAEMDLDRDATGRMNLAPLVRIPQDGDEDFRWAVKQVLDLGGMGIILPHVDTKEEAVRLVRAMRYPPTRESPYQEPRGERDGDRAGLFESEKMRTHGSITARRMSGRSIPTASCLPWPSSSRERPWGTSTRFWRLHSARSWWFLET